MRTHIIDTLALSTGYHTGFHCLQNKPLKGHPLSLLIMYTASWLAINTGTADFL